MKRLVIDIETAPALVDAWGLFDQNIGLNQVRRDPYLLCFAAKWYGEKKVSFSSTWTDGKDDMVQFAADLLDEADVVIHYNGTSFDIPHLQREILLAGKTPPAPYKQIDLYRQGKRQFKWLSNKLDYVSQQLGVGQKVAHPGHSLWTRVMDGDEKAQKLMQKYNEGDVRLTEKVYDALLPWLPQHPHSGLFVDSSEPCCPRCGSTKLQRRGTQPTVAQTYPRFQCQSCGGWSRGTSIEDRAKGSRLL